MRDYFLGGPLAHQEALGNLDKDLVVRALLGHRSARAVEESPGKEILSLLALGERADPLPNNVLDYLTTAVSGARSAPLALGRHTDPLASILSEDFLELCRLEATTARREWLFFLIAFLRVATTMWMLAHLRITIMVRDWVLSAALKEAIPTVDETAQCDPQALRRTPSPVIVADSRGVRARRDLHACPRGAPTPGSGSRNDEHRTLHSRDWGGQDVVS